MRKTSHNFVNNEGRILGFTLIELLAAMAILAIIVLMMGRLTASSLKAWEAGTRLADMNASARAVLDFMRRDIALAAVDSNLTLCVSYDPGDYNDCDRIHFVSFVGDPNESYKREARLVTYSVQADNDVGTYVLQRGVSELGKVRDAYDNQYWFRQPANTLGFDYNQILDDVAQLKINYVQATAAGAYVRTPTPGAGYKGDAGNNSVVDDPPAFIEITLSLMAHSDIIKWKLFSGNARKKYFEQHAVVYTMRAYPMNRRDDD